MDLYDVNSLNLLIKAVEDEKSVSIIKELLTHPIDINEKSNDGQTAADIAWEKKNYEILLTLLEANSTYPEKFNFNELQSDQIKKFLTISENIHEAIKSNDFTQITEIIESKLNLRYFYNSSNVSAATTALNSNNYRAYEILLDKNCSTGPNENLQETIDKAVEMYETNVNRMKIKVADLHSEASKPLPEKHLMIHYANIVVAHDDQFVKQRVKHIKNAYKILNGIPLTRQILQLTAMYKNFKIHFDFNRSSVDFMNPYNTSASTRGLCENFYYKKFHLYVAAKELLDETNKFAAIGTLAHELCHFAMNLTFINNANPYDIIDGENKVKFNEIVSDFKNINDEKIVNAVYEYYDEPLWPSELIVRVPHMIVNYHNDSDKLSQLKITFKDLFDYFDDFVVAKMTETLPMLEKLCNESTKIEFDDLTDAYMAKIHHSNVKFQGKIVKFNEIISDISSVVFELLTSEQICKILLKNERITVGSEFKVDTKFYIERDFIDYDTTNKLNEYVTKNFDQISSIADEMKIILLSDKAGAGKTTTFKHLSEKLKVKYPNYWISYVDLKRHLNVYEKYENKIYIFEIMSEILNFDDEINAQIFKSLYDSNKVILLFDGVDEISPKYKEFFIKLIENIRKSLHNQQWIATRPQHTQELMTKFNQKAFKFLPFDNKLIYEFIKKFLNKPDDNDEQAKGIIKTIQNSIYSYTFDSPLMLQMITEIYVNDKTILESNMFSLYDRMIEMKVEFIEDKGKIVSNDRDNRKAKMTIWEIHQVYALKLLHKDGFEDVLAQNESKIILSDFEIFKRWKKEKTKWTSQQISRYGFLIVDNWNTNDEFPDFVHRTFAEFFVAQFLIQELYELDEDDDDDEIELRMKFIIYLVNSQARNEWAFISSYIDNKRAKNSNNSFLKISKSSKVQKLITEYLGGIRALQYLKFFSINEKFSKEFRFDDETTIFQKFFINKINHSYVNFFDDCSDECPMIIDIYEIVMDADWIHNTGYWLSENFSMPSDDKIHEFLDDFIREQDDEDESRYTMFKVKCVKFFKLLHLTEQAEIPQGDILYYFRNNFQEILKFAFRSKKITSKFMNIIESNFKNCENVIDESLKQIFINDKVIFGSESYKPSDEYIQNVLYFCDKLEKFVLNKVTIISDHLKFFHAKIFAMFCSLKNLKDLFEKYKIYTQIEIQEFLIKYIILCIDQVIADEIIDYEVFLREIFKDDQGQLRKLLETRYESEYYSDFRGHTLISFVESYIEYITFDQDLQEEYKAIKNVLLKIAKEIEMTDEEIKILSVKKICD